MKGEDNMKNKNRHLVKNVIGTLTIPVLVAVLLQGICMFNGKTMISKDVYKRQPNCRKRV